MFPALAFALVALVSDIVPHVPNLQGGEPRRAPEEPLPVLERTTAHYALRVAAPEAQTAELAAVLEAAWPKLAAFFRAEPKGKKKLEIEVYSSRADWARGILDDGVSQPAEADRSWFSNRSKKLYVYRSPIDYVTRAHLIYGATLQFHALAKSKNLDLDRDWYVHGIGEMLSSHTWNQGVLELEVERRISTIDLAALARDKVRGAVRPWSLERIALPSVRCMAVRFARERFGSKFEKFALGGTGSKVDGRDFLLSLGSEARLGADFTSWLEGVQLPLDVLSWEFQELADGRILGLPPPNEVAACRLKEAARSFEATIPVGAGTAGSGALMLALEPPFEFDAVRFTDGAAYLERYSEGARGRSEKLPLPRSANGKVRARAEREGGLVRILADGVVVHEMPIEAAVFGLVAVTGAVEFENVAWQ